MRISVPLICSLVLSASCAPEASLVEQEAPSPSAVLPRLDVARVGAAAGRGLDLTALVDQIRRRYRVEGVGFAGGDVGYRGRVEEGRITFQPGDDGARTDASTEGPLILETIGVDRDGRSTIARGAAGATVDSDGSLRIERGAVVEHLHNRAEGIEQSWTFARRPRGTGDLRVRAAAEGMRMVAQTESGLHRGEQPDRTGGRVRRDRLYGRVRG